jgi:DNA repair photolyase
MTILIDRRDRLEFESDPMGKGRYSARPADLRGRGARDNTSGRYENFSRALEDDGWQSLEDLPALKTMVMAETAKQVITRNESPDIAFDRSINPYRGCEHGCSYCYARPAHAYMGLSPGLDFESKLFAKLNAPELLRQELLKPGYQPRTVALGANTDPYQPIEKTYRLTRQILEVLSEFNHPVGIVTKSALVLRDLDILKSMASRDLVKVAVSVTTLDPKLARKMEPRAATPPKRLSTIETLAKEGIPTVAMVAPIIPALNDNEIEAILKTVAAAGATEAGYVLLRLPLEVSDIFANWLKTEYPDRASRVLSLVRQTRDGKENDATFGRRMTGSGPYAWTIGRRFEMACTKLGLNRHKHKLALDRFIPPPQPDQQLRLL